MPVRTYSGPISALFRTLLIAGLPATGAYAQLQIAESLLIDLNATTFNTGSTTWTNAGTLTGNFSTDNTTPTRLSMDGRVGVLLDGQDHFLGPVSTPGIDGAGTVSIEVWAYQGIFDRKRLSLPGGIAALTAGMCPSTMDRMTVGVPLVTGVALTLAGDPTIPTDEWSTRPGNSSRRPMAPSRLHL
jgi:hypothetical protein